jgi:hypothetical protein
MECLIMIIHAFIKDYMERHKNPLNAALHIVGVPMVFFGIFRLCCGDLPCGMGCFLSGYLLQYLGHRAQGNEVGEVTLLKKIWVLLAARGKPKNND